jgi:hypothetical protein
VVSAETKRYLRLEYYSMYIPAAWSTTGASSHAIVTAVSMATGVFEIRPARRMRLFLQDL